MSEGKISHAVKTLLWVGSKWRVFSWSAVLNLGMRFFFWIEFQGTEQDQGDRLPPDLPAWIEELQRRWEDIYLDLFNFHTSWTVSSSPVRIFDLMVVSSYGQGQPKQKNTIFYATLKSRGFLSQKLLIFGGLLVLNFQSKHFIQNWEVK